MNLSRCLSLLLVVASAASAASARAAADEPRALAAAHYARGIDLAEQGLYDEALDEFNQAVAKSPHFAVLYNIGQVQIARNQPRAAIEALSTYLRDGGEKVPLSRREQVKAQIAQLEAKTVAVTSPTDRPIVAPPEPAAPQKETESDTAATLAPPKGTASDSAATLVSPGEPSPDTSGSRVLTARRAAYASAGLGVAAAAGALAVYLWNRGRYEDWEAGAAALRGLTPGTGAYQTQVLANNDLAASLTSANHAIMGLSIASGLLVATGASLWIVDRRSRRAAGEPAFSSTRSSFLLGWSGRW